MIGRGGQDLWAQQLCMSGYVYLRCFLVSCFVGVSGQSRVTLNTNRPAITGQMSFCREEGRHRLDTKHPESDSLIRQGLHLIYQCKSKDLIVDRQVLLHVVFVFSTIISTGHDFDTAACLACLPCNNGLIFHVYYVCAAHMHYVYLWYSAHICLFYFGGKCLISSVVDVST